jgi:hypothetical protein
LRRLPEKVVAPEKIDGAEAEKGLILAGKFVRKVGRKLNFESGGRKKMGKMTVFKGVLYLI